MSPSIAVVISPEQTLVLGMPKYQAAPYTSQPESSFDKPIELREPKNTSDCTVEIFRTMVLHYEWFVSAGSDMQLS